jgi:hypothetical protein
MRLAALSYLSGFNRGWIEGRRLTVLAPVLEAAESLRRAGQGGIALSALVVWFAAAGREVAAQPVVDPAEARLARVAENVFVSHATAEPDEYLAPFEGLHPLRIQRGDELSFSHMPAAICPLRSEKLTSNEGARLR